MREISDLRTLWVALILILSVGWSIEEPLCGRILRLVGTSIDVAGTADELRHFFDRNSDSSKLTSDAMIKRLDEAMAASKTSILSTLLGTTNLDSITEAYDVMLNSVSDLKNLIQESNGPLVGSYKQYFIDGYRASQASKHIRFLPELPTYILPDLNIPLLEQLKRKTKCDRRAIAVFRDFYGNLLSNGIALQDIYIQATSSATLETVLKNEWEGRLQAVQTEFGDLELHCFDDLTKSLADSEQAHQQCAASLRETSRKLGESDRAREQLDASLKDVKRELEASKQARAKLEASLQKTRNELDSSKQARMQAQASLREALQSLTESQRERQRLESSLHDTQKKLHDAKQAQQIGTSAAMSARQSWLPVILLMLLCSPFI